MVVHAVRIREKVTGTNFIAWAVCSCGWEGTMHSSLWNLRPQMREANRHKRRMERGN